MHLLIDFYRCLLMSYNLIMYKQATILYYYYYYFKVKVVSTGEIMIGKVFLLATPFEIDLFLKLFT